MHTVRHLITLLALASFGRAGASCAVQGQLDLDAYSGLQALVGSLTLTVQCDLPTEQTTLRMTAPGARDRSGDLTLPLSSGLEQVTLTVGAGAALLDGVTLTGTQTLRYRVTVQGYQWVPVGWYATPVTLSLSSPLP